MSPTTNKVTVAMVAAGRCEAERHQIFGPRQEKWIMELTWARIYWAMERAKFEPSEMIEMSKKRSVFYMISEYAKRIFPHGWGKVAE